MAPEDHPNVPCNGAGLATWHPQGGAAAAITRASSLQRFSVPFQPTQVQHHRGRPPHDSLHGREPVTFSRPSNTGLSTLAWPSGPSHLECATRAVAPRHEESSKSYSTPFHPKSPPTSPGVTSSMPQGLGPFRPEPSLLARNTSELLQDCMHSAMIYGRGGAPLGPTTYAVQNDAAHHTAAAPHAAGVPLPVHSRRRSLNAVPLTDAPHTAAGPGAIYMTRHAESNARISACINQQRSLMDASAALMQTDPVMAKLLLLKAQKVTGSLMHALQAQAGPYANPGDVSAAHDSSGRGAADMSRGVLDSVKQANKREPNSDTGGAGTGALSGHQMNPNGAGMRFSGFGAAASSGLYQAVPAAGWTPVTYGNEHHPEARCTPYRPLKLAPGDWSSAPDAAAAGNGYCAALPTAAADLTKHTQSGVCQLPLAPPSAATALHLAWPAARPGSRQAAGSKRRRGDHLDSSQQLELLAPQHAPPSSLDVFQEACMHSRYLPVLQHIIHVLCFQNLPPDRDPELPSAATFLRLDERADLNAADTSTRDNLAQAIQRIDATIQMHENLLADTTTRGATVFGLSDALMRQILPLAGVLKIRVSDVWHRVRGVAAAGHHAGPAQSPRTAAEQQKRDPDADDGDYVPSSPSPVERKPAKVARRSNACAGEERARAQEYARWRSIHARLEAPRDVLKEWILQHFANPFPTADDKAMLADVTGLSGSFINNYFINARVRFWRPLVMELGHDLAREAPKQSQADVTEEVTEEAPPRDDATRQVATQGQASPTARDHLDSLSEHECNAVATLAGMSATPAM